MAGLYCIGFLYVFVFYCQFFQFVNLFEVVFEDFVLCIGVGIGNGIISLNDRGEDVVYFYFIVVGVYGIVNGSVFVVFFVKFYVQQGVGQFCFFFGNFVNIVEQAGLFGYFGLFVVQAEFGSYDGVEVGGFNRVFEQVLFVG